MVTIRGGGELLLFWQEQGQTLGDFRERFSTRLHTCAPASHPVLGVGPPPSGGRPGGGWSRRRRCVGEDTVHVFPPPTSPRWGEARRPSTLPWTTTREVLFKKSPKHRLGLFSFVSRAPLFSLA